MEKLPVEGLKERILSDLKAGVNRFVISAPTASGKSTKLPQIFAESEKIKGQIIVLQPRRIAARFLAKTVAQQMRATLGKEVGWNIRFDKNCSAESKIVFETEGILARQLLSEKTMQNVGAVILDEFHERNLYSDISLALAKKLQNEKRQDLVIAVCSASMDDEALCDYFGKDTCTKLECSSRLYDVDILYAPKKSAEDKVWDMAARQFDYLARTTKDGNFLIFMPGVYEINRTIGAMLKMPSSRGIEILPLYGNMPINKQDEILTRSERRKAIVATNVAETSLTIEGVKYVIDSGLAKIARYDASRGVNTLFSEKISMANAVQRAGRAGRTSNGVAIRLWTKSQEQFFEPFASPEIERMDLSEVALWVKSAGMSLENLPLFEKAPEKNLEFAYQNLKSLNAVDNNCNITSDGRILAKFPTQVKYAKLLFEACKRGCLKEAAFAAAIIDCGKIMLEAENQYKESERNDALAGENSEIAQIAKLCQIAKNNSYDERFCRQYGIHSANARKAETLAQDLYRTAQRAFGENTTETADTTDALAKCVISAFSENLCVRTNDAQLSCQIANGKSGIIAKASKKFAEHIFCALNLQEQLTQGKASIVASMCVPVCIEQINEVFKMQIAEQSTTCIDERHKRVICKVQKTFRGLALEQSQHDCTDKEACAKVLLEEILKGKLVLENFNEKAQRFITRANFAAECAPKYNLPKIDDEALQMIFADLCYGKSSYTQLRNVEVLPHIKAWYSQEQLALIDYLAPDFIEFANRKKPCYIEYNLPMKQATLSASFKDLYNFNADKIKIADGNVKLTYQILAPNYRPIQSTQNLASFWQTSWKSIRKEIKARYPKHFKSDADYA